VCFPPLIGERAEAGHRANKRRHGRPERSKTKKGETSMSDNQNTQNVKFAALCVLLTGGLAAPASAQTPPRLLAREQGFSLPASAHMPVVVQTQADAACDLHLPGDTAHALRLYANPEGYVLIHFTTRPDPQEVRAELDCTTASGIITYPLHLRTGSGATADMPAPQTSIPIPKAARVLPALTDDSARLLTDYDLVSRGYEPRPDPEAAPEAYTRWLSRVSRPLAVLPTRSVSTNIPHSVQKDQAGITSANNYNWSGLVATRGTADTYSGVQGEWYVPTIIKPESGNNTHSAFWVGVDGYNLTDLIQAGTEQDSIDFVLLYASEYFAWTEILPDQLTEQTAYSVNPGDDIYVGLHIGDSTGAYKVHGGWAWITIYDYTQGWVYPYSYQLTATYYGKTAEWIMERPQFGSSFAELTDYGAALMFNAIAETPSGTDPTSFGAANLILTLTNQKLDGHPDNNVLSSVASLPPNSMSFVWSHFH
jgi:hypothetical protein